MSRHHHHDDHHHHHHHHGNGVLTAAVLKFFLWAIVMVLVLQVAYFLSPFVFVAGVGYALFGASEAGRRQAPKAILHGSAVAIMAVVAWVAGFKLFGPDYVAETATAALKSVGVTGDSSSAETGPVEAAFSPAAHPASPVPPKKSVHAVVQLAYDLAGKGDLKKAVTILEAVPKGAVEYDAAQVTLKKWKATLAKSQRPTH